MRMTSPEEERTTPWWAVTQRPVLQEMLRKVNEWIDVDPGDLRSIIGDTSETENEKEKDEGKTRNMVRKTPALLECFGNQQHQS